MNTAVSIANGPAAAIDEICLGAHSNGMLLSPEEFDAIEAWDENFRYELVHGVLIVSPPPRARHGWPVDELAYRLIKYQREHPQGAALDGTLPERYVSVPGGRRICDRAIWAGLGRQPNPLRDTPTIVVEVVSPSQRDRHRDYIEKRTEYAAAGVQEYWIFDPDRRTLTVHRRDGSSAVVAEADTLTTPLLPGFELKLADLLAQADAWEIS